MLHSHLNLSRKIGCEFEMTVPKIGVGAGTEVQETLAGVLTANGLRAKVRGYDHSPVPAGYDLVVEYDSSVRGESRYRGIQWYSVEIKTRILNGIEDWERIVPQTLAICSYMGARVNRSCGHHLHIEFPEFLERPTVVRSLYNLIHRFEPVLYGLLAPSRRESSYASPMPNRSRLLHGCKTREDFHRALFTWQRRYGFNLIHLWQQEAQGGPRIEFRYHQGTLCPDKARHWVRLVNRLVEHAVTRNCQASRTQVNNTRSGFETFRYTIGLRSNAGIYRKVDPELKETSKFLLKRWKQFNMPNTDGEISSEE